MISRGTGKKLPLIVAVSLLILLLLSPTEVPFLGIPVLGLYYLLVQTLRERSHGLFRRKIVFTVLVGFLFAVGIFYWVLPAVILFGKLSTPFATLLFLLAGAALCLKVLMATGFLLLLPEKVGSFRIDEKELSILFCIVIPLADLLSPEIFPWSFAWLENSRVLTQLGIGGSSFATFVFAILGVLLTHSVYAFLREKGKRAAVFREASVQWFFTLTLAVLIFGVVRMKNTPDSTEENLKIALIQPNNGRASVLRQNDASAARFALNFVTNLSLKALYKSAGHPGGKAADLLIIPESAVPFHSTHPGPAYSSTFDGVVRWLAYISGATVVYNELLHEKGRAYNALSAQYPDGDRVRYRKNVLVPFGEALPPLFAGFQKWFPETGDYTAGQDSEVIEVRKNTKESLPSPEMLEPSITQRPNEIHELMKATAQIKETKRKYKFLPVICYEILFGKRLREQTIALRPDFILNLTNDSWFQDSVGLQFHLKAARWRAVELGRTVIQAALTGISAAYNPYGEDLFLPTEPESVAVRVFSMNPANKVEATPYVRLGNLLLYAFLLFLAVYLASGYVSKRNSE